jgi:3D (Asp-Asp-Asp) domain-containing protein
VNRRSLASMLLVLGCAASDGPRPVQMQAVVVRSPVRLPGAVVQGASRRWFLASYAPPRYGDPVPVMLTAYCLHGTTRRGRYVRSGIVAADPRLFPLSRYIELYDGRRYLGRFLVDDTGRKIKGSHIDVWMSTCPAARVFGRRRGTAVLVPRQPSPTVTLAGSPSQP